MLKRYEYGEVSELPSLVIAHGLFGSARNWRAVAKKLSADRKVITLDMRNHGDSFWSSDHSYAALAADLAETIKEIEGPVDLMGHSMGGKAAMVLALTNPLVINRLIVVDIAPIQYSHSQMPGIEAMKSVDLSKVSRRSDADVHLQKYIPDAPTRAFFLQSLILDDTGHRWALNLDSLGQNMDAIMGFPEVDSSFEGASMFLIGGASNYVTKAGKERIARLFPFAETVAIPDAGHWLHAEAMKPFVEKVQEYLS